MTCDNLRNKGNILVNRCFMCDFESTDHLLLCWRFARALWELAFSCLSIAQVVSKSIRNHLLAWEVFFGGKVKKKEAMVLHHVISWSIWREKSKSFDGLKLHLGTEKKILSRPFFWG